MMKDFNKKCYEVLKTVPKGKIVSYKQIAEKLKSRNYRGVGNAMKLNFNKEIPCHRVIRGDGWIGGFNKGVKEKIKLLKKEGVKVVGGKVNVKKYSFKVKN